MFEAIVERARRAADARAARRRAELLDQLEAELPPDVWAESAAEGVRSAGRRLARRAALDPALRGLFGRLR